MKICLFVLVCALMVCLVTSAQGDPPSDDDSSQNSGVSDVNTIQEVVTPRLNVYHTIDPDTQLGSDFFGIREDAPNPNALLNGAIIENFFHPQNGGPVQAYMIGHIINGIFEQIAPGQPLPNWFQRMCYQVIQRLIEAHDFQIVPPGDNLGEVIDAPAGNQNAQ